MKIIRINELVDTERDVKFNGGTSYRALLKKMVWALAFTKQ